MSDNTNQTILTGNILSPGLGLGNAYVYRDDLNRFDEFYDVEESEVEEELKRFDAAIVEISDDLEILAGQVKKEIDVSLSDVFRAHIAMIDDDSLKAEVQTVIREELVSAGSAVRTVFRRWERRFRSMEAEIARKKADDMHDLARRLVLSLAGVRAHALEEMPSGSVLIATRLLPSDTIFLDRRGASAAVLEVGGATSHAALFAQEIGLPCIAGIPDVVDTVPSGMLTLVDADAGTIIINPDQKQKHAFQNKSNQRERKNVAAKVHASEPAITTDGTLISVFANVGTVENTREAVDNGADGIGLYRIERVYLGRQEPPNTTALLEEIAKTLLPAKGLPVYVRLLDVGADKALPFMEEQRESNPSLGCRGIRFLLEHPNLLQTQLDALLHLSSDFNLHILVPMVTLASDMLRVKEFLAHAVAQTNTELVPKLGAMIETPAAALAARSIAAHADFLSVGTNDLTQYTFAADRENTAVDSYFDDVHDVIFRLLRIIHDDVPHVPLSVCGKLASHTDAIPKILKCGVTTLSVVPPIIPAVKQTVRNCDIRQ